VYVYAFLHWLTGARVDPASMAYLGSDLLTAQRAFQLLYVLTQALVFAIYLKAGRRAPPAALVLLCLSKRVHSIFVLRLFNDGVAMLLAYVAVLLFAHGRWRFGCVWYSAAVSIKMNVLLFAPGLLLLLVQAHAGPSVAAQVWGVLSCLAICAGLQVLLALPFLLTHPVSYVRGAFDLGRVFMVSAQSSICNAADSSVRHPEVS